MAAPATLSFAAPGGAAPGTAGPGVPVGAAGTAAAPRTYLTTDETAALLRLSPRTLEKLRTLGGGPRFRKFGTRVVYAWDDLRAWADSRAYDMTPEPGRSQRASTR